jgi:glycosyltransferase involved in cell wall biosynthesis
VRVLSISSVYPNPAEPGLGLFVRSRLQSTARHVDLKVIAPVPILDYSHPQGKVFRPREFPMKRRDGPIEVFHPRWAFPPCGTPSNVLFEFGRLFPLVASIRRDFRFDLIDAHFAYPEGCAAALLSAAFRVPFTITLRGSETMFDGYRYRRASMKAALRRAAAVITVSDELRAFALARDADAERTRTIPNGVDADTFRLQNSVAMRQRHDLPLQRKLILAAGELIEAKGHHLIVEVLKGLRDQGMDAELLIAGATARGGPQFERALHERVQTYGLGNRVRFLGWVGPEQLSELFSAVDVFCLASYTEGWPNVVNEALACGTPVVATRVGGVAAMLRSSVYGTIVPQQNIPLLQEAVLQALNRNWDRAAISKWGSSRTWDTVAHEVVGTFADAVKMSSGIKKSLSKTAVGSV